MTTHQIDENTPTIVFDLDGTLVDSARDLILTLNKVIETEGLPAISLDHVGHLVGQGALKMLDRAYAFHDKALDETLRTNLHKQFLEIYAEDLANETIAFEGAFALLDELKTRGWTLAVCTNKYEGMSKKLLKELKMDHYFSAICGSDTFPMRKPDPSHLTNTIEMAGGSATKSIMIGDSVTDIKTAQAADIPVIAVTFGYSDVPVETLNPTKIVSSYPEMGAIIDELVADF